MYPSRIEMRLRAALKYDVINGTSHERSVLASQIAEAIETIEDLRTLLNDTRDELERHRERD